MPPQTIELKIRRQEGPDKPARWERFSLPYRPRMNVISCLQEIQRNPVTKEGKQTTPVVWDCNCLEEVCGACTMTINGKVRQSCTALVDNYFAEGATEMVLEPMKKFAVVRDLIVDRQRMFDALKRVKAWIPLDGTYDLGPSPRQDPVKTLDRYKLSECMTCGCCLEVCPQVNDRSSFIGAAAISQVELFNSHPVGKFQKAERLDALMEPGGLHDCGNAQNCVRACPKEIPLTTSIGSVGRQLTVHALKKLFVD